MGDKNQSDNYFSLSVIGDGSTGKSSIINAFKTDGFVPVYKQTIGIDFYEKTLPIRGDLHVALRIWDCGGQSIHSKNLETYIVNSDVIFLVYDVTNLDSFKNLDDWLGKARKFASKAQKIYAVGNKIDLYSMRQVTPLQHDEFVGNNNLAGGLYMSAKTGENVVKTFYQVAAELKSIRLTSYELGFYDKILTAHVDNRKEDEGRTAFADSIEAEDLAAEARKTQPGGCGCVCS